MMWKGHESPMLVAGHRGERFTSPENTMTAFRKAIGLGVDMIETDIRMTADGELVLMHDEAVDRTTDGTGLVREMPLERFLSLNAACDYEDFAPEAPPTLAAFLDLCAANEGLLLDFELKEYPEMGRDAFAYACADKAIAMIEAYGLADRCVLNAFSGKLLEYITEKYHGRYRLHGYYPYEVMRDCSRNPASYLYCLCMISVKPQPNGMLRPFNFNVCPAPYFDRVKADGVIPWVGTGIRTAQELARCAERGATLVTTDAPGDALTMLRALGLHT